MVLVFQSLCSSRLCSQGVLEPESQLWVKVARARLGTVAISTSRGVGKVNTKGELLPGCSLHCRGQRGGLAIRPTSLCLSDTWHLIPTLGRYIMTGYV